MLLEELQKGADTADLKKAVKILIQRCEKQQEEIEMMKKWNPLYSKRIYFLGSSWTYGLGCDGKDNFAMRIARKNHMDYINESVSTTTYIPRNGRTDSYYERADFLPDERPDYLLLQMSSNDPRHTKAPVGHVTDFYEEDLEHGKKYDLGTIAGAMEATISKLMRRYPGTKFAWYTGFRGPVKDSEEAQKRVEEVYKVLMEEIAPKWGTPVCDLTCRLGLNTYVEGNNVLLTKGDAQHCITPGYAAWETAIEAFLKSL